MDQLCKVGIRCCCRGNGTRIVGRVLLCVPLWRIHYTFREFGKGLIYVSKPVILTMNAMTVAL